MPAHVAQHHTGGHEREVKKGPIATLGVDEGPARPTSVSALNRDVTEINKQLKQDCAHKAKCSMRANLAQSLSGAESAPAKVKRAQKGGARAWAELFA